MTNNTDFKPTDSTQDDIKFEKTTDHNFNELKKYTPEAVAQYQIKDKAKRKKHIYDLMNTLDPKNIDTINNFGLEPQEYLAKTPDDALKARDASNKNLGEVGQELKQLSLTLKNTQPEDNIQRHGLDKIFHTFIKKAKQTPYEIRANYQSAGATINTVKKDMEASSAKLADNNKMLAKLYKDTRVYYVQLQDYIDALVLTLKDLDNNKIPHLKKQCQTDNNPLLKEDLRRLQNYRTRVSQKLYDLQLSQAQALDYMPQLDLINHTNQMLQQQIHDSIIMQIPNWRREILMHLALMDAQAAQQATDAINETNHKMMENNRDTLQKITKVVSDNNNRGIISEDDLKENHKATMNAIEYMQKQIAEGNKSRDAAMERIKQISDDANRELHEAYDKTNNPIETTSLEEQIQKGENNE